MEKIFTCLEDIIMGTRIGAVVAFPRIAAVKLRVGPERARAPAEVREPPEREAPPTL